MSHRKTLLAASIIAGLCIYNAAQAQDAPAGQADVKELDAVSVTGIRMSLAKSLDTKRNADAVVDAITAEDIGKFPSTNVAEAMSTIPGVTIDRRFGQGERVSIDGTDPSLNLTFLDGHPVAQTAWLFGEQSSRGFDYTLLAPEILGRLEVFKSPEARLPEGSIGGTVVMHTRQPLDLDANTVSGSVGMTYNDQAGKGKPNASVLYSWKNPDQTFGVAVSGSHYEEQVDRQGMEIFRYSPVSKFAGNPRVAGLIAGGYVRPTDQLPDSLSTAWFQQHRKRDSATVNLQFKPSDALELDLRGLYVKEDFANFNQSMITRIGGTLNSFTDLSANSSGLAYAGHSCGNEDPDCADPALTQFQSQARESTVTTKGLDLQGSYRGNYWGLTAQAGVSKAEDGNNSQAYIQPVYHGGYTWNASTGPVYDDPAAYRDPANWVTQGNLFGSYSKIPASAKDTYGQVDFSKDFSGVFNQLRAGVRYARHNESHAQYVYNSGSTGTLADVGGIGYADILNGPAFAGYSEDAANHLYASADAIRDWILGSALNYDKPDPATFLNNTWSLEQTSKAAYVQLDYASDNLHGNIGLRYVRTDIAGTGYTVAGEPMLPAPAGWLRTEKQTYNQLLPSFNLVYDAGSDVVLRLAGAKVMAWAPYNQLVHNTFLNDAGLTGSGGNARLDPYESYNFNFSAEWYFADQAMLAGSVFFKRVLNYISTDARTERQFNPLYDTDPGTYQDQFAGKQGNCDAQGFCDFSVQRPYNGGAGTIKGFTVNYQQPFGDSGFGLNANYTFADGQSHDGKDLPYTSRHGLNISPYFERGPLSARLTYGWRSHYLAGGYVAGAAPASVDDYTELDGSLGWTFNDHFSLSLEAMNLLNEKYLQYLGEKQFVAGKYETGRRYMATLHFKF